MCIEGVNKQRATILSNLKYRICSVHVIIYYLQQARPGRVHIGPDPVCKV